MWIKGALFSGNLTPYFAQKLRRDADVGGNLRVGQAVGQVWILRQKCQVALFGCSYQVVQQSVLCFNKLIFRQYAKVDIKIFVTRKEIDQVGLLYLKYNRWLNGLYVDETPLVRMETCDVKYPIIFGCKLDVMLCVISVNAIHLQTPRDDEGIVPAKIIFLKYELFAPDFSLLYPTAQRFPFFLAKREIVVKIGEELRCFHSSFTMTVCSYHNKDKNLVMQRLRLINSLRLPTGYIIK